MRRLEGWNTPIEVWAENLPEGVTGPGKVVVPVAPTHYKGTCGEDLILDGTRVEYPLKVAAGAHPGLNLVRFHARGVINGKTVDHVVIPNYWWSSTRKIWGPAESAGMVRNHRRPAAGGIGRTRPGECAEGETGHDSGSDYAVG